MRDHGISISPRLQQSPLWKLPARSFRLWCYLAMKAQHRSQNMRLTDGQRIAVARGQWLTSARKLRSELGHGLSTILSDLETLRDAGAISLRLIPRSQSKNGGVPESGTGGCSRMENAECVMATLITVYGLSVSADPVPEWGTKEVLQASPVVSPKDEREWKRAQQILEAEGR